jgi:hypothetical protein
MFILTDLDKSVAFYRDVLALEMIQPPSSFASYPGIMALGNTVGAQMRSAQLRVPGSPF